MTPCPICGEAPDIPQEPKVGDTVECPQCEAELEIVSLSPLTFEAVDAEDIEDDDEFLDEDDEEDDDDPDDEDDEDDSPE